MVGNPEDRSSRIEAQITSMSQFHFHQIDKLYSSNYSNRATKYVYARKPFLIYIIRALQCIPLRIYKIQPKTLRFPEHSA